MHQVNSRARWRAYLDSDFGPELCDVTVFFFDVHDVGNSARSKDGRAGVFCFKRKEV